MLRALLVGSMAALFVATGLAGATEAETSAPNERLHLQQQRPPQLLGFVDWRLVRVDPGTLQTVPGKTLAVGSGGCAPRQGGTACWSIPPWTVSRDGARLAVARNDASSLQVVDVRRMRVASRLRWGYEGGSIGALAWLAPRRMLAIQETFGERQRVVAFDLVTGRMTARRALSGTVVRLGRTARELVMVLTPAEAVGTARIAVADPRGVVRIATLERIVAGSKVLGRGSDHRVDARMPGLAVDPKSRRAFVVADGLVAEIDLRNLAVTYHSLDAQRSLLSRLWNWLEPAAEAKQVSGYHRRAEWLGGGLIAVSGSDTEGGRYEPAGLHVIDSRDWEVRTLDPSATAFEVAANLLLATGSRWNESEQRSVGIGLAAYGVDGEKRFQLFDGDHAWLAQAYGGRAYVGVASSQDILRIVDLASGGVTGVRDAQLPRLLLGAGSGWWD